MMEKESQSQMELNSALFEAVDIGDLKKIELLLLQGADPNAQNEDGQTPIDWAKADIFKWSNENDRNAYKYVVVAEDILRLLMKKSNKIKSRIKK